MPLRFENSPWCLFLHKANTRETAQCFRWIHACIAGRTVQARLPLVKEVIGTGGLPSIKVSWVLERWVLNPINEFKLFKIMQKPTKKQLKSIKINRNPLKSIRGAREARAPFGPVFHDFLYKFLACLLIFWSDF